MDSPRAEKSSEDDNPLHEQQQHQQQQQQQQQQQEQIPQQQQPQQQQWNNVRFYIKSYEIRQNAEKRKKPFALYHCNVSTTNEEWEIKRRYNEFFKLHKKLQRQFRQHQFIHFPRRRLKGNLETKLLEKRKRKIGLYIQDILHDPEILHSETLHKFLSRALREEQDDDDDDNDEDDSDSDDAVEPPVVPDDIPSPKVRDTSPSIFSKTAIPIIGSVFHHRKADVHTPLQSTAPPPQQQSPTPPTQTPTPTPPIPESTPSHQIAETTPSPEIQQIDGEGTSVQPRQTHSPSVVKKPIGPGQAYVAGLREEIERRQLRQTQKQQPPHSPPEPEAAKPKPKPKPETTSNPETETETGSADHSDPSIVQSPSTQQQPNEFTDSSPASSSPPKSLSLSTSSITLLANSLSTAPTTTTVPQPRPQSANGIDSPVAGCAEQPPTSGSHSATPTPRRTSSSADALSSELLQISDFYPGGDPKAFQNNLLNEEDSPDDIEYFESSEKEEKEIRAATLDKIIEKLTSHQSYDSTFLHTVMVTYRSFTTPIELFDKLIQRWNYPPPLGYDTDPTFDFEQFKKGKLDRIRLRVTQTIKFWLENFYTYDFDEVLLEKLRDFIETVMVQSHGEKMAAMLRRTHDLVLQGQDDGKIHTPVPHPAPLLPSALTRKSLSADQIPLLDWPMKELARQICIIDFEIFTKIQPKECLNQSWTKESRQEKAPNIFRLIQWFNSLSQCVGSEIVMVKDLKARIKALKKLIELAKKCRDLNDFNAVFALTSGLNVAAVHRLRKTWDGLSKEDEKIHDDLNALISRDKNFKAIRTAVKTSAPPCVPYIGNYLTDLLFIEEGHPKLVNKKINVIKCTQFATVIRDIKMYQNSGYEFDTIPALRDRLLALHKTNLTEDQIYEESLLREERIVKARAQPNVASN